MLFKMWIGMYFKKRRRQNLGFAKKKGGSAWFRVILHFAWFYTLSSFYFLLPSLLPLIPLFVFPSASDFIQDYTELAWMKLCVLWDGQQAPLIPISVYHWLRWTFSAKPQSGGIRITENTETSVLNNSCWTKDAFLRLFLWYFLRCFTSVIKIEESDTATAKKQKLNGSNWLIFTHKQSDIWWISTKCGNITSDLSGRLPFPNKGAKGAFLRFFLLYFLRSFSSVIKIEESDTEAQPRHKTKSWMVQIDWFSHTCKMTIG